MASFFLFSCISQMGNCCSQERLLKKGKILQKSKKRWSKVSAHKNHSTLILWPVWFNFKLFWTTIAVLYSNYLPLKSRQVPWLLKLAHPSTPPTLQYSCSQSQSLMLEGCCVPAFLTWGTLGICNSASKHTHLLLTQPIFSHVSPKEKTHTFFLTKPDLCTAKSLGTAGSHFAWPNKVKQEFEKCKPGLKLPTTFRSHFCIC